jgi:S-adenosyl-L-methionine hydrolase (adenosine-forming)
MPQFVSLLTDFGDKDGFVGIIKSVIYGINPNAIIIDLAHDITPGDINAAAFIISQTTAYSPLQTIFCVIVDPGVGSVRKAIVVQTNSAMFVCPDNGVLKYIFEKNECRVFEITNRELLKTQISNTFHGRDIFGPIAAHLSYGVALDKMGPEIFDYCKGTVLKPTLKNRVLTGAVIYIDRFGNLVTNIPKDQTTATKSVTIKNITLIAINKSYSSVKKLDLVALIGSHNYLEIAQRDGNAQQKLDSRIGDSVTLAR